MLRTILALLLVGVSAKAQELRGVWIANTDSTVLESRASIAETMEALQRGGINVVYPVVWSKGATCYPSETARKATGAAIDARYGARDPLAQTVYEAHRRGIEVVAWFEYGFAAEHVQRQTSLLRRNPGWAAIGPDGKRVTKNGFTWANSLDPEVQAFLADMIVEVADGFDVDGVQGDDRLPALPSSGGYDAATLKAWTKQGGAKSPRPDDPAWVRWRADRLSDWLAGLQATLKAREGLLLSASPSCYDWGLHEYLQDAQGWARRGLVDTLHPQAYRQDLAAYRATLAQQVRELKLPGGPLLAPGILVKSGKYLVDTQHLLGAVAANREAGCAGEVHFFLEGLRAEGDARLGALRKGPYAQDARAPWRMAKPRPAAVEAASDPLGRVEVRAASDGEYDLWIDGPHDLRQVEVVWSAGEQTGTKLARLDEGLARVARLRLSAGGLVSAKLRAGTDLAPAAGVRAVLLATRASLR